MQLKSVLALAALFFAGASLAAPTATSAVPMKEGEHYKIANPAGKTAQPEVLEFFSYTCPACFKMESFLADWKQQKPADVQFKRMHVVGMFGAQGDLYAKAYYTIEALGLADKAHVPFFNQIHLERKPPRDEQEIASFIAKFGVKEETVLSTMKSFAVNMKMGQAKQAMEKYRLRSVPVFIINDKFYTDGGMAKSSEMLNGLLNQLPLR